MKSCEGGSRSLPNLRSEAAVASHISESPDLSSEVPRNMVNGVAFFLVNKEYLSSDNFDLVVTRSVMLLNSIFALVGADCFKSNVLRYITDSEDPIAVLDNIEQNAEFWISLYGPDFFMRFSPYSKERKTQMMADIDENFYISAKGGNGVANFGVDFAIGIKSHDYAANVPRGEMWRMGVDTEMIAGERVLRVIQSGSGIKMSSEGADKSNMFDEFKKRYKITPQRLLALLSLYIGNDLGFERARSITLHGIRQKRFNLTKGSRINFDYDALFSGVGFQETESKMWREANVGSGFYELLRGSQFDNAGLQMHEVKALDAAIQAFNNMTDVFDDTCLQPVRLCSDETKVAVEASITLFRDINRR